MVSFISNNPSKAHEYRYGLYPDNKVDETRSLYPQALASGWFNYADSQVYTALVSAVSASTIFLARQLIITNRENVNRLVFYDHGGAGAGVSVTAFDVYIAQSQTEIIDLKNIPFHSGVFVSNLQSQCSIRIVGILVMSTW